MRLSPSHPLPVPALTVLALLFVGFSLAVVLQPAGLSLPGRVYTTMPTVLSLFSAGMACWAAWRGPAPARSGWRPFAAGLTTYALGDVLYTAQRQLHPGSALTPSWGDAAYLLCAPLLAAGMWRVLGMARGPLLWRQLLDIATVVITVFVLLWHFVYAAEVQAAANLPGLLVNLCYPLQDSLLLSVLLLLLSQKRVPLPRTVTAWLGAGLSGMFVADVLYAVLLPTPYSYVNELMDVLYVGVQGMLCLAVVGGVYRPGETRGLLPTRTVAQTSSWVIVLCFGLLTWEVQTVMVQHKVGHDLARLVGDVIGTGLVTLAVVLRQNLAFRENRLLSRKLRRSADELAERATHDHLTGLPNRHLLKQRLQSALQHAETSGDTVAVLCLDLDRFKTINDGLGHEGGDHLLRAVAAHLSAQLRPQDTLARQGGDEFLVVLPNLVDAQHAEQLARHLLHSLREPFELSGRRLTLTASAGMAVYPRDAQDASALRRLADAAMYRAKAAGGNALTPYAPGMSGGLNALELEQALRAAVAAGDFELYYQPLVGRAGREHPGVGPLQGVEVLVRWRQGGELIRPDQFIPLAEATGLIVPLGAWVLHTALRQLSRWDAAGVEVPRLAINVSARQFVGGTLYAEVESALQQHGVAPGRLELELTESTVSRDLEDTVRQLAALRALGVRVAVDDFGTGQSSLSLLRAIPADTLKIDRSFVKGLPADTDGEAVVRMVLALARALHLEVVAEGVETLEQWQVLSQLGCNTGQGYAFAPPLPAADLTAWLRQLAARQALAARPAGRDPSLLS